jgi:hypothetical protein
MTLGLRLSLGLLALLVMLAPYAMSLRPFEDIYTMGVYGAKHSTDALFPVRQGLILLGLGTTVFALGQLILSFLRNPKDLIGLAPHIAVFLASAVIGWRSYPYWAEGVYQVDIGAYPSTDQDPKALMPMVWIGDLWRMPVVLLYLVCYVAIPLLVIASVVGFLKRRYVPAGITAAGIAVAVVPMIWFSPNYLGWLMD